MSRAHRRPPGQRERGMTLRPNAAEHIAVPPAGMTACPQCTRPGYAVLDARGVKIYHSAPWPCRIGGRFADLVTVADPERQTAWWAQPHDATCPRCSHRRDAHDGVIGAPDAPTPCTACECPGPAAVTRLEDA